MPLATVTPGRILFLSVSGFIILWLLGAFTIQAMDSIPSPFTIEIDGRPITKVDDSAEDHTQAKLGKDAAVFSLKENRLQCNGWIIGRNLTENRSYGPKKVSWYKENTENKEQVQLVTATKEGEAYQLIFTKGTLMVGDDDMVFVDLLGEAQSKVELILQGS